MPFKPGSDGTLLSQEIARAFAGSSNEALGSLAGLRDSICLYVEKECDRNASLHTIVENVTMMLTRARLLNPPRPDGLVPDKGYDDAVVKQVLAWCGEFYQPRS